MLSEEAFQKLLFDLFCLWHDVQRHYDPPITHTEEEKMQKVKRMICKLFEEIEIRIKKIKDLPLSNEEEFIEEWTMLTWNVLCITSRFQNNFTTSIKSNEDKVIFSKLNFALVDLVNHVRETKKPPTINVSNEQFNIFSHSLTKTMQTLHDLYRTLKSCGKMNVIQTKELAQRLQLFAEQNLGPFVEMFKSFCNEQSYCLWQDVRNAQIARMVDYRIMPHEPVNRLVSFYSHMMHRLAILCARLQGFRYELTLNKVFENFDPVQPLSDSVFSALELLMSDCVLATEPSVNPILVTNNLFAINCGALARGVVFKQFDIQIVTEEAAEHIQSEMRRQKMLQHPSSISTVPSAALLAMKPTSGTKRGNQGNETAHKKSDVNSKEIVTIYPVFNSKNRYWAASYPHLLCTTRQKGRHSTHNSFQDLSPNSVLDAKSNGKRPIFYFHICGTMFSPSGRFANAHTLSLPLTIATRRNQDCQVQRMMSSYTATCFWLYGNNCQDGLLLQWIETGMSWEKFKILFAQHFRVNAEVQRGLQDCDFDLLQYKIQCNDCKPFQSLLNSSIASTNKSDNGLKNCKRIITFKNMLCPHLRYECGSTNVRFSVWRGMLELLQIFQDTKTNVRKLWEKNLILGFLEFDQVSTILEQHQSALIMRLSFITGGTICFTVKSNAHSLQKGATAPMHLEPLDFKKLQAKCLKDYLQDIAAAEKVKYIINSKFEPVLISDVVSEIFSNVSGGLQDEIETSRHISSNVTHVGDIDAMQHITFTAMRIAVVTCKLKPPSADPVNDLDVILPSTNDLTNNNNFVKNTISNNYRLPAETDDFVREIIQLCNFHGKSKQDLVKLLNQAPENLFANLSISNKKEKKIETVSVDTTNVNQSNSLQKSKFLEKQNIDLLQYKAYQDSMQIHQPVVITSSLSNNNQDTFSFQYSPLLNTSSLTHVTYDKSQNIPTTLVNQISTSEKNCIKSMNSDSLLNKNFCEKKTFLSKNKTPTSSNSYIVPLVNVDYLTNISNNFNSINQLQSQNHEQLLNSNNYLVAEPNVINTKINNYLENNKSHNLTMHFPNLLSETTLTMPIFQHPHQLQQSNQPEFQHKFQILQSNPSQLLLEENLYNNNNVDLYVNNSNAASSLHETFHNNFYNEYLG